MSALSATELGPLSARMTHHRGYLVQDLERAAHAWYRATGIGPFLALEHVVFDHISSAGRPVLFDHSIAFAASGSGFIEIQQFHDIDAALSEQLTPPGGVGLNHIAVLVDDVAAESARLTGEGFPQFLDARTGDLVVALHDARHPLGFAVEIHQRSEQLAATFSMVSEAASTWDHRNPLRPFG